MVSLSATPNRIVATEFGSLEIRSFRQTDILDTGSAIRYDSLMIEVSSLTKATLLERETSWGNLAYGCKLKEFFPVVANIIVTSNQPYNADFPAGKNLADIMRVAPDKRLMASNIVSSVPQQIPPRSTLFTIIVPPATNQVHQLTITYILDNGAEFTALLKGIRILK